MPVCFMIMPYGRKPTQAEPGKPAEIDFNALWDKGYVPVIKALGYEPVRADQDTGSLIVGEMLERLYFADLVLADMTIPNGNVYYEVGIRHAAQKTGTQLMDEIRGLVTMSPMLGWGLILGTLAILGMPPFGVFASEFLILITAISEQPWAAPFLLGALGLAFAAVFSKVQPMVFGATTAERLPVRPAMVPVYLHLALVLMLGLWIPPFLADWYRQAARLIG